MLVFNSQMRIWPKSGNIQDSRVYLDNFSSSVITDYDLESRSHVTPCSGKSTPSSRHGTTTPGSSSGCHLVASAVKESRTSKRLQIVLELFQTEKNYVGILHTILKVSVSVRAYIGTLIFSIKKGKFSFKIMFLMTHFPFNIGKLHFKYLNTVA